MASKNSKFNTPPSKSARPNTDKEASEALELSKAIDLVKIELRVFRNNLGKVRMKEDQLFQSAKRLKAARDMFFTEMEQIRLSLVSKEFLWEPEESIWKYGSFTVCHSRR